MMKKIAYLAITVSLATLTGCGGGSSDSGMTSDGNSASTGSGNTELKCDRGILLNSNLTAQSIFDEPLYSIDNLDIMGVDSSGHMDLQKEGIYAEKISRNGQMIYSEYLPIYNLNLSEIETDEQNILFDYNLNSSGLYTTKTYQKQNNGWPVGYITTSNNLTLSLASFNDTCNFSADKLNYTFERIDLSGKKFKDILPNNISTQSPKKNDYLYINPYVGQILIKNNQDLNKLLNSDATFPSGSIIYLPKSAVYDDNQITFSNSDVKEYQSLEEWLKATYGQSTYKHKKAQISGLNVMYSVDSNDNPLYGADDPGIEMNGKIYDGEWNIKGDILSTSYGVPSTDGFPNNDTSGEHTLFNKTAYDFISAQIQTYYK